MDDRSTDRAFALKLAALVFALMLVGAVLTASLVSPSEEYPTAEDVPEFEPSTPDGGRPEPVDLARVPRERQPGDDE